MSRKRISMRRIKEILRLRFEYGMSRRQIASSLKLSRSTVGEYLVRFDESGISWEEAREMETEELENRLKGEIPERKRSAKHPVPDWHYVFKELKRKGVTLQLLWQEYHQENDGGYSYSQYCDLYRQWKQKLHISMRQNHKAGEKLFIDYSGMKVPITDPMTGEIREANIFVATLGASSYSYIEAHFEQNIKNWVNAHVRAFEFFGGTPEILVPDNLKAGVTSPCYYDPDINPTYHRVAEFYQLAVIPTRVKRPKDKAKVEVSVQVVERSALAPLRNRTFFSVQNLNEALRIKMDEINNRTMKHIGKSRRELFLEVDKPSLRNLPVHPFEYSEWKHAKVGIDYHVSYDHCLYSVPYQHLGKKVMVKGTERMVEIFLKDQSIALHKRLKRRNECSTTREHMPKNHRQMVGWKPERFIRWAEKTGTYTLEVIEKVLESKIHPQQSYRKCMGILKLGERFSGDRLENACRRALSFNTLSYKRIKSILDNSLDQVKESEITPSDNSTLLHENIRGEGYYREHQDA